MQQEAEIWKSIKNFPKYDVSNLGRVRSCKPYWKKPHIIGSTNKAYPQVSLSINNKKSTFSISHLVLEAFVGLRPPGYEANHKDGIKGNGKADNLEWTTHAENMAHASRMGLCNTKGIMNSQAKLCNEDVLEIRRLAKLGVKRSVIAEKFSTVLGNIDRIINRSSWRHI